MPIYAYKCGSCGHARDVLQKLSDAPLAVCPACGAAAFAKQVTAAGFQLKGSGWYATDFRGGSTGAPAPADGGKNGEGAKTADSAAKPADAAAKPSEGAAKPADSGSTAAKSDAPKASAGGSDCH
ncbi:MAG TPA: FmdB family zinc ribbon protein [Ramlibacter sp.]|nr:FmdB family zinc ribbon protein [Ramlibacter sp.]